jgi:hypothetical protein
MKCSPTLPLKIRFTLWTCQCGMYGDSITLHIAMHYILIHRASMRQVSLLDYRYSIFVFFRVSQILRKKGKFVPFLFCRSYFMRFKTIDRYFLWHTITNIISTCFIFGKLKMVAKNAKIWLPQKKKRIYSIFWLCKSRNVNGFSISWKCTAIYVQLIYYDYTSHYRCDLFDTNLQQVIEGCEKQGTANI